jgi:hypothetical protein
VRIESKILGQPIAIESFKNALVQQKNGLDVLAQSLCRGEREESLRLHRHVLSRSLAWLIKGIWFLCQALLVAWATLAIYYSNLPWAELRLPLAAVFAAFAIWALWLSHQRRMSVVFIVLFLGVVIPTVLYILWGVMEILTLPTAPQ